MTTTTGAAPPDLALSDALREGTRTAHEIAESAPFVGNLLAGTLPLSAYVALLGQLSHVYRELEAVGDALVEDPVAGPVVREELRRTPALEQDLLTLDGPGWRERATPSPATQRYVSRLAALLTWPPGFVAHHYTRYLGDLAGGQAIRVAVERSYDLAPGQGTGFFDFPEIPRVKPFRDVYRATLDVLPISAAEQTAVVEEASAAFRHNTDLLLDLGARFPAAGGQPDPVDPS